MRSLILATWLAVGALAVASPAEAQTRFSLLGGGLIPFSDLSDAADPGPRFGARLEYQPVNALGQRRLISGFVEGAFAQLELSSDFVDVDPSFDDPSVTTASAGFRVYAEQTAFFLQGGAGWLMYSPAAGDDLHGVDVHAGAGFLVEAPVLVEVDVTLHQAFGEDDLSLSYLVAQLGVSLPF